MSSQSAADRRSGSTVSANGVVAVVIPAAQSALREAISPGSGCVARNAGDGYLLDYEDNDLSVRRLAMFADRVAAAAERAEVDAPTRARVFVMDEGELLTIGEYHFASGQLNITDRGALAAWLGAHHVPDHELIETARLETPRNQMGLF